MNKILPICCCLLMISWQTQAQNNPAKRINVAVLIYPGVELMNFADNIITASGVTSGIDAAMYVVSKCNSQQLATIISKGIQYLPHREESWPEPIPGFKYAPEKTK